MAATRADCSAKFDGLLKRAEQRIKVSTYNMSSLPFW